MWYLQPMVASTSRKESKKQTITSSNASNKKQSSSKRTPKTSDITAEINVKSLTLKKVEDEKEIGE